jgi:hypothetical protein
LKSIHVVIGVASDQTTDLEPHASDDPELGHLHSCDRLMTIQFVDWFQKEEHQSEILPT